MTYGIGNPGPGFEKAQKCGRVKPVNAIPTFPLYKQTINLHRLVSTQNYPYTITKINDNINMDSAISVSGTKICSPTESVLLKCIATHSGN